MNLEVMVLAAWIVVWVLMLSLTSLFLTNILGLHFLLSQIFFLKINSLYNKEELSLITDLNSIGL